MIDGDDDEKSSREAINMNEDDNYDYNDGA